MAYVLQYHSNHMISCDFLEIKVKFKCIKFGKMASDPMSELNKAFEWQEYFRDLHHSGDWPLGSFLGGNDVLDEKIHPEFKLIKQETEEYVERFLIEKLKSLSHEQQEDIKSNVDIIIKKNQPVLVRSNLHKRKRFAFFPTCLLALGSTLILYKAYKHST